MDLKQEEAYRGRERQRIALARAFIKKVNFLILDEATSKLDFISEAKIYDTIFVKGKNTTMLIIAHRLSTIRNCDIIYVMDKGNVVEQGSHEEFLNEKGYYYRLYVSQVGAIDKLGETITVKDVEEETTNGTLATNATQFAWACVNAVIKNKGIANN